MILGTGYSSPVPIVLQALKRVILPVVLLLALMVGLGLLVTKVLQHDWPFTAEDGFNRELAGDRTGFFNGVTWFFSLVGSTPVIIGVTVVVALILRVRLHRWREPIFLCLGVAAQAVIFFFTTLIIDRARPDVPKMDESPPTSSFPSGHTSAAVALYCGMAFVLALLVRRTWLKWLCWALVLVPVAVAASRMYRGMHHPSDVTASFLNGILCVTIATRAVLNRAVNWSRERVGVPIRSG
jgi:membrane-associated phospholipid phosphatase